MYTMNYLTAKSLIKNNIVRSFAVYCSDFLSFLLLITSSVSVIYLFIFDTTFFTSIGVFTNDLTLGIASFLAVTEITALYYIHYYFKLKKNIYFSVCDNAEITFYDTFRCSLLTLITLLKKMFTFFVFMSPFMLTVSAIYYLHENGYSQNVIYISVGCATLLFISGLVFFRMYILKYTLINYVFINNKNLPLSEIFRKAENLSDGKLIRLFILRIYNLPKKLLSVFLFPAVYYLPYCHFSEYDFLLQKENPYSVTLNTDKSVVFYMKEYGNI